MPSSRAIAEVVGESSCAAKETVRAGAAAMRDHDRHGVEVKSDGPSSGLPTAKHTNTKGAGMGGSLEGQPSARERLMQLKQLKDDGLVSEAAYEAKMGEILAVL